MHDLRTFTHDQHRVVDDVPYGGGPGMVLKPEPIFEAVEHLSQGSGKVRVLLLSPQGRCFHQTLARELAAEGHIIFICGRYEGVDERVRTHLATDEVSIGDYVLAGGELPALVVIEALVRLIPGALGDETSALEDSFSAGLLDHTHYTRPASFRGLEVPPVLRSGDHEKIRIWRRQDALRRTLLRRPDLLSQALLSEEDRRLLEEIRKELA